jgi:hypothetical protein
MVSRRAGWMDGWMDGAIFLVWFRFVYMYERSSGQSWHTARHGTARGRRFEGGILETNLFYSVTGIVYIYNLPTWSWRRQSVLQIGKIGMFYTIFVSSMKINDTVHYINSGEPNDMDRI